jgi:hypothetical protein
MPDAERDLVHNSILLKTLFPSHTRPCEAIVLKIANGLSVGTPFSFQYISTRIENFDQTSQKDQNFRRHSSPPAHGQSGIIVWMFRFLRSTGLERCLTVPRIYQTD